MAVNRVFEGMLSGNSNAVVFLIKALMRIASSASGTVNSMCIRVLSRLYRSERRFGAEDLCCDLHRNASCAFVQQASTKLLGCS